MLNVTFVGGGSLRLLPIVRSLFKNGNSLKGGSIRLCDLKLDRAEAVGRMIQKCPEFKNADCKVMWTNNLDEALEGADALYVTMAIERQPQYSLSQSISVQHGFMHSDQLSLNGAFLSTLGGPMILNFARKMEKICPKAIMLIFANPVAVYSAMVNNYTKIKALGVCAGFGNHRWDLPRLVGRDEYDDSINVVSSGVNHLSFITRGKWGEKDLFTLLNEQLDDGWKPMEIKTNIDPNAVQNGLQKLYDVYKRFDTMIFSGEEDGIAHVFWEDVLEDQKKRFKIISKAEIDAIAVKSATNMKIKFADFMSQVNVNDASIWNAPPLTKEAGLYGISHTDIANPIFQAMNGDCTFQIAASANNAGAVAGFADRTALEYTMVIDGKDVQPVEDQYIPSPFYGLIASLAEFQTILGDAIATDDPRLFANALAAYPIDRFSKKRNEYIKEMFDIYNNIPRSIQKAKEFI